MELTKSEMEIMDVFWASENPLSRSDLLESSAEKTWKDSSVHILLNGLLKKGLIHEAGLVKRRKTYGRLFAPSLTREEYFVTNIFSYRHKPQPMALLEAFIERVPLSAEDLHTISGLFARAAEQKENESADENETGI